MVQGSRVWQGIGESMPPRLSVRWSKLRAHPHTHREFDLAVQVLLRFDDRQAETEVGVEARIRILLLPDRHDIAQLASRALGGRLRVFERRFDRLAVRLLSGI